MALKRIVPLSAATLLLLGLAIAPALALLPNGQQAPDFQLIDLSNNVHKLSNYRGKVVVIDFFGAYCSYCKDDAKTNLVPLFNDNYKSDAKVQFLSVETSGADAATITGSYLQGLSIPWPVLSGGTGLVKAYDFTSVPTLYVVDPAGKVALTMQYPTSTQTLKATIDKLEASVPTPTPTPTAAPTATPTVTPTPSPTTTPTPTVTPKPIEKTPTVTPTVEKPTVTPTPAPTAMPSVKPAVKQSESSTAPTNSPAPSPTSESERSNNTQPAAPTQPGAEPKPTPQVTPEPQSNATKSQPSAPNAEVKSTKPTTSPTPTPQAVTPQATPNVSPVQPSTQSIGSDDSNEPQNSTAIPILPPADDSSANKNAEQLISVDSTSASDTSQGTSLDTTPRVPVATDASNTAASTAAAPTEQTNVQTNSVASLPPQPVLEFSMLGLGLPAIVVGAVYLMMRRL